MEEPFYYRKHVKSEAKATNLPESNCNVTNHGDFNKKIPKKEHFSSDFAGILPHFQNRIERGFEHLRQERRNIMGYINWLVIKEEPQGLQSGPRSRSIGTSRGIGASN
jgi:hypothetical protein